MKRSHEPTGEYITRSMTAYPALLNKYLAAVLLIHAGVARAVRTQNRSLIVTGKWSNAVVSKSAFKN